MGVAIRLVNGSCGVSHSSDRSASRWPSASDLQIASKGTTVGWPRGCGKRKNVGAIARKTDLQHGEVAGGNAHYAQGAKK